jgi:hypothetical protein
MLTRDDSATATGGGDGLREQAFTGNNLYDLLKAAASDAQAVANSGVGAIYTRMEAYMRPRLPANTNTFLSLMSHADGGGGGWSNEVGVFSSYVVWAGAAGVLPGIGSQYGVTCVVIWR